MADSPTAGESKRRCTRCGTAVSDSFVRVFGLDDVVHGCLNCLPRNRLSSGEAARPEDVSTEPDLTAWQKFDD